LAAPFGGLVVTHFAARHQTEVAGIVLEDSTHPEHNLRTLALLPPVAPGEPPALTHFRDELWIETYRPLETDEHEWQDKLASIHQMRAAWDLGDIPLLVLTAGEDEWEEGFPTDVAQPYEDLWMVLQKELAARSTRGIQTTIAGSGHIMHVDAPEAVDQAVHQMLALF
jgi:pimeloyl-ACP methyl ester carboxylesterase